jgi:hypothetical protein
MRDRDVRAALLSQLQQTYAEDADTRIVEEMGIWSGSVRIDVAVINGELSGFELKSDRDTLERLPFQAELYGAVFDRITLVVGTRHHEPAAAMVPQWWGITVAVEAEDKTVRLREVRAAGRNPSVDPYLLAQLLWKDEAIELLERVGAAKGMRSRRVKEIHQRVAAVLSSDELAGAVRTMLKRRREWLRQLTSHQLDVAVDPDLNP